MIFVFAQTIFISSSSSLSSLSHLCFATSFGQSKTGTKKNCIMMLFDCMRVRGLCKDIFVPKKNLISMHNERENGRNDVENEKKTRNNHIECCSKQMCTSIEVGVAHSRIEFFAWLEWGRNEKRKNQFLILCHFYIDTFSWLALRSHRQMMHF